MAPRKHTGIHEKGAQCRGHNRLVVSPQDEPLLSAHAWRIEPDKRTSYAVATLRVDGRRTTIRLHRLIAGAEPGQLVDHINGNGLDNRRENLRLCTYSENARNRQRKRSIVSRYKGVSRFKRTGKWQAQICVDGVAMHLGFFDDEADAASAYDDAARKHFGAFARPNNEVRQ